MTIPTKFRYNLPKRFILSHPLCFYPYAFSTRARHRGRRPTTDTCAIMENTFFDATSHPFFYHYIQVFIKNYIGRRLRSGYNNYTFLWIFIGFHIITWRYLKIYFIHSGKDVYQDNFSNLVDGKIMKNWCFLKINYKQFIVVVVLFGHTDVDIPLAWVHVVGSYWTRLI